MPKTKSQYVIVRTYSAGVFAGFLQDRAGKEVVLTNAPSFTLTDWVESDLYTDTGRWAFYCAYPVPAPASVSASAPATAPATATVTALATTPATATATVLRSRTAPGASPAKIDLSL